MKRLLGQLVYDGDNGVADGFQQDGDVLDIVENKHCTASFWFLL